MFRLKPLLLNLNYEILEILILLLFFTTVFPSLAKTEETKSNAANFNRSTIRSLQREDRDNNATKKLVCFYVFTDDFSPKIMEGLCTHIHVGFLKINNRTFKVEVSNDQEQILTKMLLLKEKSKDLKIITAIGGAGESGFSAMISNHSSRKTFIKSCIYLIKKFKSDGIDLDWEWPVVENGNEKEKVKFVKLLQEIQVEFRKHKKKYVLSIDVPSVQTIIELGYLVTYISDFVDYVNVMCYDYHYFTKFFPFTGHNAPLYSNGNLFSHFNVNSSIFFWISSGMPRDKIILGLPTYGHTYKLIFPKIHSVNAPAKGVGSVGQNGFAAYQQICQFIKSKTATTVHDTVSKTPYAYQFPEWISFDDEGSLAIKASYALEENLAGAMVFSVNADDVTGSCKGDGIPLPLIRRVRNILFNEV